MTQEYLSRKIVTAWLEERRGEPAADAPEGTVGEMMPGYAVKYSDGYTSWCPKEKFEADTLPLGNVSHLPLYQQRLLAETIELNQRSGSLGEFLESAKTNPKVEASMSARGFELLKQQHVAMEALLSILDQRIEDMSDISGIQAIIVEDPLLNIINNGTEEALAISPPALKGKLGQDDQWLLEKIRQASEGPDKSILNQWGHPDSRAVEVQVPVVMGRVNVLGLLASGSFDHSDTIGTFGVKEIVNAAGEKLVISEGEVQHRQGTREVALVVRVVDDTFIELTLNKETGNLTIVQTSQESLVGAVMIIALTLHNLNRRSGQ